jgi:hypothetical protein
MPSTGKPIGNLRGTVLPIGSPSLLRPGDHQTGDRDYRLRILPGAWRRLIGAFEAGTLAVPVWIDHSDGIAGTVTLMRETPAGLYLEADVADTRRGRRLRSICDASGVANGRGEPIVPASMGITGRVRDVDSLGMLIVEYVEVTQLREVSVLTRRAGFAGSSLTFSLPSGALGATRKIA